MSKWTKYVDPDPSLPWPISYSAVLFIAQPPHEDLSLVAYRDSRGKWTIGRGRTAGVKPGDRLPDVATADREFLEDLKVRIATIKKLVRPDTTENQLAAYLSLAYNIGMEAFETSTTLRRHNAGDLKGAAEAMQWFHKETINGRKVTNKGLVARRAREAKLYLKR